MNAPLGPRRERSLACLLLAALLTSLAVPACSPEGTRQGVPAAPVAPREAGPAPFSLPAAPAAAARRDLARDEALGGHTLARHVGKTDEELRKRLSRERRISAASTYADRETAETVVAAALAAGAEPLGRWLAREGPRPNLVLDHAGDGRPIGRSLRRGDRAPRPAEKAVVVLRWDGRRGDWYVLTSYPEASR